MKSTGMVRSIDELGRIVLPIELRRNLNIKEKDSMEIYVNGNQVILKKYEPACVFCGNAAKIKNFNEKNICSDCIKKIKENI